MPAGSAARRCPKVTATLDADLLRSVDAYVAAHPHLDRSGGIKEALRLWRTRELEWAMEQQFASHGEIPVSERQDWNTIRRGVSV